MSRSSKRRDDSEITSTGDDDDKKRRSLRPLVALQPYVLAHKGMLAAAALALVLSAAAMLSVPIAVRRMIDHGFGTKDGGLINNYFLTLIGIGLVLALASASRFYCVNWLGERVVADLRANTFAHLAKLGPSFFEKSQIGRASCRERVSLVV